MRGVAWPAASADVDLRAALDRVRAQCDSATRRIQDPVGFVHRYEDPQDQELVGLIAASVAFGNVTTIRAKLEDALRRLGPSPARLADDKRQLFAALEGWIHRVYLGEDIARLIYGARRVQRASGSLGVFFAEAYARHGDLRESLAALCDAIRHEGGFPLTPTPANRRRVSAVPSLLADPARPSNAKRLSGRGPAASKPAAKLASPYSSPGVGRRGPAHLLPDPRGKSGSKRMLLYLRWMIRPADGVDLGLWPVPASALLCPVDTHIHKLARNLGLTRRPELSWATTGEITSALARLDPNDPVKYDFSLCHLGMLQRCPSRRDPAQCEGCGVKPVCRHWSRKRGDQ